MAVFFSSAFRVRSFSTGARKHVVIPLEINRPLGELAFSRSHERRARFLRITDRRAADPRGPRRRITTVRTRLPRCVIGRPNTYVAAHTRCRPGVSNQGNADRQNETSRRPAGAGRRERRKTRFIGGEVMTRQSRASTLCCY